MDYLLDFIFPRTCLVCGRILSPNEKHVCDHCLGDLPRTYYSRMPRNPMSDRLNALLQRDLQRDPEHPDKYQPYLCSTALFYYRSGYKEITRSLKYHGNVEAGRFFSEMLAEEIEGPELYSDVDVVMPVPLHWTRRWSRGYNQAEVIGEVVARRIGASLRADALVRCRRTRTQTRLSVESKASNVAGAFAVRKNTDMSGFRHILIVDDVFTTGATVYSCCRALRGRIPTSVKISAATLACVGY